MKNIFLVIVILVSLTKLAAQTEGNCGSPYNPNPDACYCWNHEITSTTVYGSAANPTGTGWDWTSTDDITVYLVGNNGGITTSNIRPPYYCQNLTGLSGGTDCNLPNTSMYVNPYMGTGTPNPSKVDVQSVDGWELLIKNFGNPTSAIGNPYFAIYNRFTGQAKFFVAVFGQNQGNSSYMEIGLDASTTELTFRDVFAHAASVPNPLQTFMAESKFKSPNFYALLSSTYQYQWLVAEIQTSYDPCTCKNTNQSSKIDVSISLIDNTVLSATIDGTTQEGYLVNGQYSDQPDQSVSFGSIVGSAIKTYSSWDAFAGKAKGFLDGQSDKMKDKVLKEWYMANKNTTLLANTSPNFSNLSISDRTSLMGLFSTWKNTDDNFKKMMGFESQSNSWGALSGLAAQIPYIGAIYGLVDGMFGAKDGGTPAIYQTHLKLEGSLVNTNSLTPFNFFTPGSKAVQSQSYLYPKYNNILGVFNILKTPTVKYGQLNNVFHSYHSETDHAFNDGGTFVSHCSEYNSITNQHIKQYKLDEDIKYIINPQSQMEVMGIDACLVFEYPKGHLLSVQETEDYDDQFAVPYADTIGTRDFFSNLTLSQRIAMIEKTGLDLEYISPGYPDADGSTIRFRTKYVPLQQLKDINVMLFGGKAPLTYVKMIVKTKHKTQSNKQYTNVFSYNITEGFENATWNGTSSTIDCNVYVTGGLTAGWNYLCNPDYYSWDLRSNDPNGGVPMFNPFYSNQENLVTYNASVNPNPSVAGKILLVGNIPSNSVIKAYNGFTFQPNGNFMGINTGITWGQNITLISGVDQTLPVGFTLPAGVSLQINPNIAVFFGSTTNRNISELKATDEEIKAICKSDTYLSNAGLTRLQTPESQDTQPKNTFLLFPNPNQGDFTVYFERESPFYQNAKIEVYNSMGQESSSYNVEFFNYLNYNIDMSSQPPGVYYVIFTMEDGVRYTQKMILVK